MSPLRQALKRLEEAAQIDPPHESQMGMRRYDRLVDVRDLKELLFHFHQLDNRARFEWEKKYGREMDQSNKSS